MSTLMFYETATFDFDIRFRMRRRKKSNFNPDHCFIAKAIKKFLAKGRKIEKLSYRVPFETVANPYKSSSYEIDIVI